MYVGMSLVGYIQEAMRQQSFMSSPSFKRWSRVEEGLLRLTDNLQGPFSASASASASAPHEFTIRHLPALLRCCLIHRLIPM